VGERGLVRGEDWRLKQQYGTGETRTGGYHTYSPNIALGCVVENRSNVTIRAKVSFFPFLDYFGAKSGGGIFGVLLNFVGNEVIKSSRIRHPVYSEWIKLAPHTEKTVWVRGILKHEYAVTGADTKLDLEIVQ